MLHVEFITSQDEQVLIVSFAIAPSAQRSLTLLRSPRYEHLLPEEERGITVGPFNPSDIEPDFLRSVQWLASRVTVATDRHIYILDISAVGEDELAQAKAVLRKMVKDGAAHVDGA